MSTNANLGTCGMSLMLKNKSKKGRQLAMAVPSGRPTGSFSLPLPTAPPFHKTDGLPAKMATQKSMIPTIQPSYVTHRLAFNLSMGIVKL